MKKLKNKKVFIPIVLVICVAITGIAIAMTSTNYDLPWTTSGGGSSGGGERSSTNYQLTDVIGQTAPGSSSSSNYRLMGGFLSIMPIDTEPLGATVTISCTPYNIARAPGVYDIFVTIYAEGDATYTGGNGQKVTGTAAYGPYSGTATYNGSVMTYVVPDQVEIADNYIVVVQGVGTLETVDGNVDITGSMTVDMGSLTSGNFATTTSVPPDFMHQVGTMDVIPLSNGWMCSAGNACYDSNSWADANESGKIDSLDVIALSNNWNMLGPIDITTP